MFGGLGLVERFRAKGLLQIVIPTDATPVRSIVMKAVVGQLSRFLDTTACIAFCALSWPLAITLAPILDHGLVRVLDVVRHHPPVAISSLAEGANGTGPEDQTPSCQRLHLRGGSQQHLV